MWISNVLYEALPAVYATTGVAGVAVFGPPAAFSAMLLIVAGGLTGWWRFNHRRANAAKRRAKQLHETRKRQSMHRSITRSDSTFQ